MSDSDECVVHDHKTFSKVIFDGKELRGREFIGCTFSDCSFAKSDLRANDFDDCLFIRCNFSMALVDGTGFRNAQFKECKVLGVNFALCNRLMFSFFFERSYLDYSSFFEAKLKKTQFLNCSLKEVDFAQADLTAALFADCDLTGARFSNTILDKADLRTAQNFVIDPEANRLRKAKFSVFNLEGLLSKYQLDIDPID